MHRLHALVVALLILSLALTGCSRVSRLLGPPTPVPTPTLPPIVVGDPVVDGWPVGGVSTDCVEKKLCSEIIDVARQEFEADNPGHPAVIDATVHDLGVAVDAQSRLVTRITSGTIWIVLFTLADGRRVAVDVGSMSLRPGSPPNPGQVIDGFTLGEPTGCMGGTDFPGNPTQARHTMCFDFPALARAAFDARDPDHGAIVSVDQYADGTQPSSVDITGDATAPPQATRHPGPAVDVFVFTLADGTRRATGVACNGSGPCVGVGSYPTK